MIQFGTHYKLRALLVAILFSGIAVAHVQARDARKQGTVHLVGMGPGDPDLVTFKAARVLKEADCVYCFDYLTAEVARFAPARKITVASPLLRGRFRVEAGHDMPQQLRERASKSELEVARFLPEVRRMIADGKKVAFADAGDPTMYCPWSWITEELADLNPTVVPGLSSFNAANAALGQSVTRNNGSIVISPGDNLGIPNEQGRLDQTLVLFTHRRKLAELLPQLQQRYPADTPLAIVGEASYERQQVVRATLGTIEEKLAGRELPKLYLVYVGDVLATPKAASEVDQKNGSATAGQVRSP